MISSNTLWPIWLRTACQWQGAEQPNATEQALLLAQLTGQKANLTCVDSLKKIRLAARNVKSPDMQPEMSDA